MTKRLKGWDSYVQDSRSSKTSTLELPIGDEVYTIRYPTRRQGRKIDQARRNNDVDALLLALLGDEVGKRVIELAEDQPHDVIDNLVLDVLKSFGFLPDEDDDGDDAAAEGDAASTSEAVEAPTAGGVDVPLPNSPEPASVSLNSSTASS